MPEGHTRPLDIEKLMNAVRQEGAKLNLRSFSDKDENLFTLSLALTAAVKKIFYEKSEMTFSNEPFIEKKPVIKFTHMMRVDAMEKFNSTTIFSTLNLAANEEALQRREYLVTLVVYLEQKFLPEFLRLLQYPYIDSDDDMEIKDGCGAVVNLIAGQFKREVVAMGYKDLMMSHFTSYINTAANGVEIPKISTEKFELSFEFEGVKRLVVEMIIPDVIPRGEPVKKLMNKRILVIDDDQSIIKTIEHFLTSKGFDVIVAFDGEEGIKKLQWCPDLVILDVLMPKMDGYEFFMAKKEIEGARPTPVIVLTAKEDMVDIFKAEGVRECLLKPLQTTALLNSIQRYI